MLETIITAALTALAVQFAPQVWRLAKWVVRPKAQPPEPVVFNHLDTLGVTKVEPLVPSPPPFAPTRFLASYDPQNRSFKIRAGKAATHRPYTGPTDDFIVHGPDSRTLESFGDPSEYKNLLQIFPPAELEQLLAGEADSSVLARLWPVPETVAGYVRKQDLEDLRLSLRVIMARLDDLTQTGVKKEEPKLETPEGSN